MRGLRQGGKRNLCRTGSACSQSLPDQRERSSRPLRAFHPPARNILVHEGDPIDSVLIAIERIKTFASTPTAWYVLDVLARRAERYLAHGMFDNVCHYSVGCLTSVESCAPFTARTSRPAKHPDAALGLIRMVLHRAR